VLAGAESWGNISGLDLTAKIAGPDSVRAAYSYLQALPGDFDMLRAPHLEILPTAPQDMRSGEAFAGPMGAGYSHRLVWAYTMKEPNESAEYEAIVDAQSGELLSFEDTVEYVQRQITGGAYPLTNNGLCTDPGQCGILQTGTPMPFTDTGLPAPNNFTNSAGVFDFTSGAVATTLTGRTVDIVDTCGAVNQSVAAGGSLNLGGVNGQHDCVIPAGSSAGNTSAARTAYSEVNRIQEMAR